MSTPTTHDPLVVNTADGAVWQRRAVTADGRGLYAAAGTCSCPETLMTTLAELAVHGIVGQADVLPMALRPTVQAMSPQQVAAIAAVAAAATPGPWWTESLTESDGSVSIGIDAGGDNWIVPCQDLDAANAEFIAHARAAVGALLDDNALLRARISELEAERHSTNEALDDAVQALRERPDGITRLIAPTQALRDDVTPQVQKLRDLLSGQRAAVEDPHDGPLHHSYLVPRDLPEPGGAR